MHADPELGKFKGTDHKAVEGSDKLGLDAQFEITDYESSEEAEEKENKSNFLFH